MEKSIDYDCIVREYKAEFKLDVSAVKDAIIEYRNEPSVMNLRKIQALWPKNNVQDFFEFDLNKIPKTYFETKYYLQSPKDEDGYLFEHYSLQEVILTDLQIQRENYKKLMKEAHNDHDEDNEKRFNAMQLACKVMSNTFYGASDNKVFAHYDSYVAGCVTWASRQCIRQLSDGIECEDIYVDEKTLNHPDVKECLEKLKDLPNIVSVEKVDKSEYSKIKRRYAVRSLYNDIYDLKQDIDIYRIHKAPGVVIYQDTDSNYFNIPRLIEYYLGTSYTGLSNQEEISKFKASPELISKLMTDAILIDNMISLLVAKIIGNYPIGLGFEGAFVVCRYLNRKKKYYGIKAADDDGNVFPYKLDDPKAYDENGNPSFDYDKLWQPKYKLNPLTDGKFVRVDDQKLLEDRINYLDYIQGEGVKVTGIDLTRRDKYKFINYYHVNVLSEDLRVCRFDRSINQWVGIPSNHTLKDYIFKYIDQFKLCMQSMIKLANFESSEKPKPNFKLDDFSKNDRNNPESKNAAYYIIERYQKTIEGLKNEDEIRRYKSYVPYRGDRLWYVICESEETRENTIHGKKGSIRNRDISKSIEELKDDLNEELDDNPREYFEKNNPFPDLDFEDWYNAKLISKLYLKHYLEALAKSMALYILGELYETEANAINNGEVSDVDKLVTKLTNNISEAITARYFPCSRSKKDYEKILGGSSEKTNLNTLKEVKVYSNNEIRKYELFNELCPNLDYDPSKNSQYLTAFKRYEIGFKKEIKALENLRIRMNYDKFGIWKELEGLSNDESKLFSKYNSYDQVQLKLSKDLITLSKIQDLIRIIYKELE